MPKKILAAALAILIASNFVACTKTGVETATTTSSTSAAITTNAATTSTTAAPTTTTTTTTAAATTATTATTAKPTTVTETVTKVLTTVKKVTTTKKPSTTAEPETAPPETRKNTPFYNYRLKENAYSDDLKYGVIRRRAVTSYIEKLDDGTEIVVKEDVSEYYNRLGYSASYEELLPAAKENRKTYASQINRVLEIVNGYRAEGGLEPLVLSEELTVVACARAEEVAWSGKHSHTRPNGKSCFTIMKDAGIESGLAGENIGWGYSSTESVCQAWKDSETHYENIMNPEFKEIGIGVAADPDPNGNLCWAQLFLG